MDHAAKRTPTHQLKALRACPRAWLQVLGLSRLLLGVPMKAPPAGAGPGGPDAGPRSATRPPSALDPVFDLGDRTRAERAAAANFDESVSAVLYTPIHLNWVQF